LHIAVMRGRKDIAALLIAKGADMESKDTAEQTPLHLSVRQGNRDIAELLILNDADVNARNKWGQTPLHLSAGQGRKDMVELLINKGADVNAKNKWNRTPLDIAVDRGHTEIVELLRRQSVNDLVKSGSVNVKDKDGRTPLHHAAEAGLDGLVRELIVKSADVNAEDIYGRTPLHCAAHKGHKNVAECLLAKGAHVDARDNAGRTPLNYAVGAGKNRAPSTEHQAIAQLLLDKGANINAKDQWGWTPLHYAVRMANKTMVELLVNRGADLSIADKRGRTAFSLAQRCLSLVRYILDSKISDVYRERIADLPNRYSEIVDTLRKGRHVYYVATDGNDSNSGTLKCPFKTLNATIDLAEPGDTIFVRGGVYPCSKTTHLDKSGEPGKPIFVRAYPGETPVFDFSVAKAHGFIITRAYWHIKGLTVTGAELTGIRLETKEAHHNILEHIKAYANGLKGIDLQSGTSHNLVLNCDSYQNFDPETDGENADGFAAVSGLGKGDVLIGCRAWNNSDDGFDFWEASTTVRAEKCYAWRNGENLWGHPCFTGNANGFKLGRGKGRHVLISCLAWGHNLTGFNLNNNTDGVILRNCTAWNNDLNYAFNWSNFSEKAREDCVFTNNISYNGNRKDGIYPRADSQYNSWDADLSLALTGDDFLSLDDSKMSALRNPDGSIPQNNFLKLAPTSVVIDKGIDIGMPFVGEKPDLGSFEYDPNEDTRNYVKMLHQYVRDHDIRKINESLSSGTDINEKDWLGYAPLHWACYFGYADLVTLLGYADLVTLLIDKGADPNLISSTGRTCLEIATEMDYEELVELLLHSDSKTNEQDESGRTFRGQAASKLNSEEGIDITQDAHLPRLDVERGKHGTYLTIRSESIPGLLLDVWCYEDRLGVCPSNVF